MHKINENKNKGDIKVVRLDQMLQEIFNKLSISSLDELDEITDKRDNARKEYDELRKKRLTEFMDGFNQITLK